MWQSVVAVWLVQRGHLFPWVPVLLAVGIGGYFSSRAEPTGMFYLFLIGLALLSMVALWRTGILLQPVFWAILLVLSGFCLAGMRAHLVDAPVLGWRYYGPVEGRIVGIDRSASDAVRLTLDRVVLRDVSHTRTPARVRIALHGDQRDLQPEPGQPVILTGHLAPPSGPVEPGGFDFQRHAWFQQLGAVGYTRTPALALAPPDHELPLFRARMQMSGHVQQALPGETGAFAAAVMTGDRSGMGQETLTALRHSNLAHLLAISGLHMGLLAGFVFATARLGFAAVPRLGLRIPAKKLSAVIALAAAGGYLALSGGNVATERAFVMVAVALGAVMADRRVLSLRAVAVAAVIVLVLRPEALLGPGFQMSFAATTALVAVFGWLREREWSLGPKWIRPVSAVVISSLVAGLATAPVAAAHFNQVSHYGLIANLLSVPLMGILVMPAAVLATCLMPLGLEGWALWAMGLGLDWILGVAHWVSALDGARGVVVTPASAVLPLLALGALFLILWQGRLRLLGVGPSVVAMGLWAHSERPDVLISDTGGLVGVMTEKGRALSRGRGSGFVALNWLENDGDAATQALAFERWNVAVQPDWPVQHIAGKRAAGAVTGCSADQWMIFNVDAPENLPCTVFDPKRLRKTGAIALYHTEHGPMMVTARQITGTRLWNAQ